MDLPSPQVASKHGPPLLQDASGTILVATPGATVLGGVGHTGQSHNPVGDASGTPDAPGRPRLARWARQGKERGARGARGPHSCTARTRVPPGHVCPPGAGAPHLPSGLLQLRVGALGGEPGPGALGPGLCAIPGAAGGRRRPRRLGPDRTEAPPPSALREAPEGPGRRPGRRRKAPPPLGRPGARCLPAGKSRLGGGGEKASPALPEPRSPAGP